MIPCASGDALLAPIYYLAHAGVRKVSRIPEIVAHITTKAHNAHRAKSRAINKPKGTTFHRTRRSKTRAKYSP